jgi:TonB family protein
MPISSVIQNLEKQAGERRARSREPLKWVVLTYFGQDNWGKLIDLNETGMRFEFYQAPSDRKRINFKFEAIGLSPASFGGETIKESFQAEGDVRWTLDFERIAGVQFANLAQNSRDQIRKWLSIEASADTVRTSIDLKKEAPDPLPTPLETLPPPAEAILKVDESESPLDIDYAVSRAPAVDTSSPLVAKILEATTFEAYSRIFEEEEKGQPKTSRSIPPMSRTHWMGAMIGVAATVVIVGIGMTVPRLVRRNHAADQTPSPAVGKGETIGAENSSAAANPRPFLVEVLDANNRRWLLWFVNNGSGNETTQATYRSPAPSSDSSTKSDSRPKQTAAAVKPATPHKFTLIVPEANRPNANSSAANSASLAAPVVRDELQVSPEAPMTSILSTHAAPKPVSAPPVGGQVQPALLIKSVPPVYPPFARSSHTSGDVTVDALIDVNGTVTDLKAVSGPPILRQAAIEAVRQWKYDPARLDGRPVAIHLTITVRFHTE